MSDNSVDNTIVQTELPDNGTHGKSSKTCISELKQMKTRNMNDSKQLFEKYLQDRAMEDFKGCVPKKKCPESEFHIPTYEDYSILLSYKLKKDELKLIAKNYRLKISGTNNELLARIYSYLKMSNICTRIQSVFRGFLRRFTNRLRGPAFLNRKICNNDSDFLTGDDVDKIPANQFISYKSDDGFIYAFDCISLHNLFVSACKDRNNSSSDPLRRVSKVLVLNPYNRNRIRSGVFHSMRRLSKICKYIYKTPIDVAVETEEVVQSEMSIQDLVTRLFMKIDEYGHYTNPNWFMCLDKTNLLRLFSELADIWCYRAALSNESRRNICPSDPFRYTAMHIAFFTIENSLEIIQRKMLDIFNCLISTGITHDDRSLGVLYLLQAFTLVNRDARDAMPWLYEAVSYS